jgi:tetraacyldisaccharide 4'-kinase
MGKDFFGDTTRMKRRGFERLENFLIQVIQQKDTHKIPNPWIRLLLWNLKQLSRLFESVVQFRLFLYRCGILRHHTLGCQVISVGNLTVGGTGKTPVVEVFARDLQRAGRKVAILSRGYKKREPRWIERVVDSILLRDQRRPPRIVSDGRTLLLDSDMSGDEPYMLANNLQDVAVLVDKDRVKSGRYAIEKLGCDTLILDDGFQYLALKHRVEIVLVDRRNPFGSGYLLPRGILREPIQNLRRADFIFITKCDGRDNSALKEQIRALNPRAEISECTHRAQYVQNVITGERHPLEFLRGLDVTALSGIAAPEGFEQELERHGATLINRERFEDHHRYAQQEILDIINHSREMRVDAILTTEKDSVRFPKIDRCDVPIYFLRVEIQLLSGAEDFNACIARICFR